MCSLITSIPLATNIGLLAFGSNEKFIKHWRTSLQKVSALRRRESYLYLELFTIDSQSTGRLQAD
jgi:hypothetical protein